MLTSAEHPRIRMRRCAVCRERFQPRNMQHKACSPDCAAALAVKSREKVSKKAKSRTQTKLPALIAKADRITSLYIRQKHADSAGNVKCISCPTVLRWKDAHCAHFIERGKKPTRWVEENLHPACPSCNVYRKESHMREYTLAIIDLYGREKIDEFRAAAKQILSAGQVRQLAEEAIAYYSQALQDLGATCAS